MLHRHRITKGGAVRTRMGDRSPILVPDDNEAEARELLVDAELGNWLRP